MQDNHLLDVYDEENKMLKHDYEELEKENSELQSHLANYESTVDDLNELEDEFKSLNDKYEKLEQQSTKNSKKAEFLDKNVVIVPDNDTNLYHKYDCKDRSSGDGYWIYYIITAISKGYEKCPKCF